MKDAGSPPLPSATPAASGMGAVRLALTSAFGAVILGGVAFLLVFWDEMLLAGPIIFLVKTIGFWPACILFTLTWAGLNIVSLTIFDRAWVHIQPRLASLWRSFKISLGMRVAEVEEAVEEEVGRAQGWRMRMVFWLANLFRPLGAIATGIFLGGPFGVPVYRILGYKGWTGYAWTLAMTPVYGFIWVSFYGRGGIAVIDLLKDWL